MAEPRAKTPSYEEAYRKLRLSYVTRLRGSLGDIRAIAPMCNPAKDDLARAQHLAHGFAGSGTIFGFPEITEAGRAADMFLSRILAALPDGAALGDADAAEMEKLMMVLHAVCESAIGGVGDASAPDAASVTPSQARAASCVLIADNDPLILQLLDARFRHAGFRVLQAGDGAHAWADIVQAKPDLVVLDVLMPGLDGLSVLRNMRGEPGTKDIPVILLSACKGRLDIESGLQAGAQDYVTKPFLPDDLIGRSLKLLKNAAV